MTYVRNLHFEETPNYDYMRDLMTEALRSVNEIEDGEYDWMLLNDRRGFDSTNKKPNLHGYGHPNPPRRSKQQPSGTGAAVTPAASGGATKGASNTPAAGASAAATGATLNGANVPPAGANGTGAANNTASGANATSAGAAAAAAGAAGDAKASEAPKAPKNYQDNNQYASARENAQPRPDQSEDESSKARCFGCCS